MGNKNGECGFELITLSSPYPPPLSLHPKLVFRAALEPSEAMVETNARQSS